MAEKRYSCNCGGKTIKCYHPCNQGCCPNGKPSKIIQGERDYKFNTIKESRQELKNEVRQVRTLVDNYVNSDVRADSVTTTTTTSSPVVINAPKPIRQLDKKFMQSIIDGYDSRGCEFIHSKFQTLTSQLNMMQNNGENPKGCQTRIAQISHIYNYGQKRGCWDGRQSPNAPVMPMGESNPNPYANPNNPYVNSQGFSNTDSLNTGKPDPRLAFGCKQTNTSSGMGIFEGRIRGDIKRPL